LIDRIEAVVLTDEQIGKAFARLRRERGLSIEKLAERSNLSYHAVLRLEHGSTRMSAENRTRICKALEMTYSRVVLQAEEWTRNGL